MFKDRMQAADKLADALAQYRASSPLILGIARGAVPMAQRVAQRLNADWDVLLAKKLGAPGNPEYAVGAVDESGWVYRTQAAIDLGIGESHLEQEKARQVEVMRHRRAQYEALRPRIDRKNRVVIVVDDGLATGATMLAALHGLKEQGARKLVCAVPIASAASLAAVRSVADDVVCLMQPREFYAVSQGYEQFAQVEDEEILALLRESLSS